MCFIALGYKTVPGYAVVLGANRDEHYDRPGLPPQAISRQVWGGVDPRAGGTWLAVNAQGRISAVTNRQHDAPPHPIARSRGLLCLDMLTSPDDTRPADVLRAAARDHPYNPFNLLVADATAAWVATYAAGRLAIETLAPGWHLLGAAPPGTADDPKLTHATSLLGRPTDLDTACARLMATCSDHGTRPDHTDAVCVHGQTGGTVSATLLALHDNDPTAHRYLHAQGQPCSTRYEDYSPLLRGRRTQR